MKHLAILIACFSSPALAQAVTEPSAIDRAVADFTGAPLGAPGGAALPVDRRLRLAACTSSLALGWYGSRQDAVLVQCPTAGWRLYVGLKADLAASVATPVVMRGDAVTISLAGEGFAVSQPGEALEAGPVGSWIKVRTLAAGTQPLRARVLHPGAVGIDLP